MVGIFLALTFVDVAVILFRNEVGANRCLEFVIVNGLNNFSCFVLYLFFLIVDLNLEGKDEGGSILPL
jgi:hypothetical protein